MNLKTINSQDIFNFVDILEKLLKGQMVAISKKVRINQSSEILLS